jgi:hypothetical protein
MTTAAVGTIAAAACASVTEDTNADGAASAEASFDAAIGSAAAAVADTPFSHAGASQRAWKIPTAQAWPTLEAPSVQRCCTT